MTLMEKKFLTTLKYIEKKIRKQFTTSVKIEKENCNILYYLQFNSQVVA